MVTGIGMVTPLGVGAANTFNALLAGKSGVGKIDRQGKISVLQDQDHCVLLGGRGDLRGEYPLSSHVTTCKSVISLPS